MLIGADDVVLSSPIILYDYPEVAPESPGDLYDSTEIDEILALRVLTLTDDEKSKGEWNRFPCRGDHRPCDAMAPKRGNGSTVPCAHSVHPPRSSPELDQVVPWWDPAADTSVNPWTDSVMVNGVDVGKGTLVRLEPSHRADAQDIFLRGIHRHRGGRVQGRRRQRPRRGHRR